MSFARMQEALRAEGWLVEWNMPCCQSCAWGALPFDHEVGPFKGQEVDFEKVLFNHSQDCEVYIDGEECPECQGECEVENPDYDDTQPDEDGNEQYIDCGECFGMGEVPFDKETMDGDYDTSVSGFVCHRPDDCDGSYFCFDGSKEGVENFKAILPIIEASGCEVNWSGNGDHRPEINWEY